MTVVFLSGLSEVAMAIWVWAGIWGAVSGGALLAGALVGYFFPLRQRVVAGIMAFGSGVLISALSFNLMAEAYDRGGFIATAIGFVAGAVVYTAVNYLVSRYGAKHRKRASPSDAAMEDNNPISIVIGAILDGIPESIVIGLSLIEGGAVSVVTVAAIAISNIPEGLSSSAGMKKAGYSKLYIFGTWTGLVAICAAFSMVGYFFFQGVVPETVSVVMAIAAGAILAMIVDTMIPEAFEETHNFAGLITVLGFLVAFALEKWPR